MKKGNYQHYKTNIGTDRFFIRICITLIITLLMVLIMILGLAACSAEDKLETKTIIDWCKEEVYRENDWRYSDSDYIEFYEAQKLEENRNGTQFEELYKITIYIADFIDDKGGVFKTRTYIVSIGYEMLNFECSCGLEKIPEKYIRDLDVVEVID